MYMNMYINFVHILYMYVRLFYQAASMCTSHDIQLVNN